MTNPSPIAALLRGALCALALLALTTIAAPAAHAENDALAATAPAPAASPDAPSDTALSALTQLLDLAGDRQAPFDAAAMAPLLDYVLSGKGDGAELPPLDGASGAMIRTTLDAPLSRVLQYAYNPAIPASLMFPSVIRLSGWEPGSDILTHPGLWTELDGLDRPVVLHGREFEEITPDLFSGGYYRYVLDRALVLMPYKGRKVLLSVAKQHGLSETGKKGVILDDGSWQYLYSGKDGLTKGGIGWMDTYLYGSWSVSAYVTSEDGTRTDNAVFKWLRAGWARLNVVRAKHILAGCRRYAEAQQAVLGSDKLPPAAEIAAKVQEISTLPEQELDRRIQQYAQTLAQAYADAPDLPSLFEDLLASGEYPEALSHPQRVAALLLEYLKSRLSPL